MKVYQTHEIKNIALLGNDGAGNLDVLCKHREAHQGPSQEGQKLFH